MLTFSSPFNFTATQLAQEEIAALQQKFTFWVRFVVLLGLLEGVLFFD